ncbi:mandelate racemase/muconate lactonizing enzyme family protein [Pseudoxanthobacter sp.]|uniref:mandelate racemase/muconate lactonizing enzyme family protein n=1 Tax=Pseudoxanthobacter sp. TaxID=1925742 RepID=UPI002FE37A9D
MELRVRLFSARLRPGERTAADAAADGGAGLTALAPARTVRELLYLLIERDGHEGVGEVRLDRLHRLFGSDDYRPAAMIRAAMAAVAAVPWDRSPRVLLHEFPGLAAEWPVPVRMLVDTALHDLAASEAGRPVSSLIGGGSEARLVRHTSQLLRHEPLALSLARAERLVARGFRRLKVVVGVGSPEADRERMRQLRARFGEAVSLSADAGGRWPAETALRNIEALAGYDIDYVEQPAATGDFATLLSVAAQSPVPVILDEGLSTLADVERIASGGGRVWANLKLVRFGGISATVRAAHVLAEARVPVMIGQTQEGAVATAAALHTADATKARLVSLSGADELADDPASGLVYGAGTVAVDAPAGLGVRFDPARADLLMQAGPPSASSVPVIAAPVLAVPVAGAG